MLLGDCLREVRDRDGPFLLEGNVRVGAYDRAARYGDAAMKAVILRTGCVLGLLAGMLAFGPARVIAQGQPSSPGEAVAFDRAKGNCLAHAP